MKTRIIWTKIYEDTWFRSLEPSERFVFIYLFTNQRIGHTGIYELPKDVALFELKIDNNFYNSLKTKLEEARKAFFFEDWVYIPKASFYGGYSGIKNKAAFDKERASIPNKVINAFKDKRDTV